MSRLIAILSVFALLSACAYPAGPREGAGTLLGAGAGALIGSQFGAGTGRLVGTAIGTLAGALIGQDIGRTLDRADRQYMQQTTQRTLEMSRSNQTSSWVNPDSGNSGTVTPTSTFQDREGRYCREYQQTVTVAGEEQQAYGTACRQPDGTWQISNAEPAVPQVTVQQAPQVYYSEPAYYPYYSPLYSGPYPVYFSFSYSRHSGHYRGWGHRGHRGY